MLPRYINYTKPPGYTDNEMSLTSEPDLDFILSTTLHWITNSTENQFH